MDQWYVQIQLGTFCSCFGGIALSQCWQSTGAGTSCAATGDLGCRMGGNCNSPSLKSLKMWCLGHQYSSRFWLHVGFYPELLSLQRVHRPEENMYLFQTTSVTRWENGCPPIASLPSQGIQGLVIFTLQSSGESRWLPGVILMKRRKIKQKSEFLVEEQWREKLKFKGIETEGTWWRAAVELETSLALSRCPKARISSVLRSVKGLGQTKLWRQKQEGARCCKTEVLGTGRFSEQL